ncbi:helix-turn-helix domain-containing protein [Metallumcola ferriviriculae]
MPEYLPILIKICKTLKCDVSDIMEIKLDEREES